MPDATAVQELYALRRSFGKEAAKRKLHLLEAIEAAPRIGVRDLLLLQKALDCLRAYPDDAAVLRQVRAVRDGLRGRVAALRDGAETPALADTGFPGSVTTHVFSYDVARGLDRRFPGCLEIAWDDLESDQVFAILMEMLATPVEVEGLEDLSGYWPDWFEACRPATVDSDLQYVLHLLEHSPFTSQQRECLYEAAGLTIRCAHDTPGSGLCEVERPPRRVRYQKSDLTNDRFPLEPEIRRPLPDTPRVSSSTGRDLLDVALAALSSRRLEILPLTGSNPADVHLFDGPRGIQVLLAGVVPEQRNPLSSIFLFLVLKNGVPIAYGPAVPFLGCCEMGINLFPEFRGFEIRHIYAQVMRVLHQVLGAELFYLTRYGMGVDNEEALESGAFWFYRKLGFVPSNPSVEALAREEEERIRAQPGYRSDRRMLVRLSDTEAWFDLSQGRRKRFDFAALSLSMSRTLAREFDADRPRAVRDSVRKVARSLGIDRLTVWSPAERRALDGIAPVLARMPDLPVWSRREKAEMVRIVRGKAARSEIAATRRLAAHSRFEAGLRLILDDGSPEED